MKQFLFGIVIIFILCLAVNAIPSVYAQSNSTQTDTISIPNWIKKTAKWWSDGQVEDRDFVQGIQYLIQKGIMKIPETKSSDSQADQKIPAWIKSNAGWWAAGQISDNDFVSGLQYLISKGIMNVSPPPTASEKKCTGYYC